MSSSILSGIYTLWNSDTVLITGLADLVFNFSADMTFKSNTPRSEFGSPKTEKTKRILANHMHLYSGRVNQTSPCKIRGMCVAFSSAEDTLGKVRYANI
jgi:hypothetical protein